MNDNLVTFNGLQYLARHDTNNDGSISLKLETVRADSGEQGDFNPSFKRVGCCLVDLL